MRTLFTWISFSTPRPPDTTAWSAKSISIRPNPVSDAFHASLDFSEVGRAVIYNGAKTVRYLLRHL